MELQSNELCADLEKKHEAAERIVPPCTNAVTSTSRVIGRNRVPRGTMVPGAEDSRREWREKMEKASRE